MKLSKSWFQLITPAADRIEAVIDWLIVPGLFALGLWLRANDLVHFVTADEHNWVYRSSLFLQALLQQDWPGTSVWLTPGVTTTWLGTIALGLHYQAQQAEIARPMLEWLAAFSRTDIDLDILLPLRWSMALFTATMGVVIYGLARKLWSWPVALLGSLFLLTEPHLLAVSRIIGHDAPVTFFTAAALLAFLIGRRDLLIDAVSELNLWQQLVRYRWFILSGVLAGLAILSKAVALFMLPFMALIGLMAVWRRRDHWRPWLNALLVWGACLWLTFILVWPAAWVDPLGQTWAVINNALLSSAGLEDADIQDFYSVIDLGPTYYLVNGAYKLSPWLMIGVVLAAIALWRQRRQPQSQTSLQQQEYWWLLCFALGFTIFMTFGVKRSPRYILPAFPALAFLAAWGWLTLWPKLKPLPIVAIIGGLALMLSLQYAPYYFTYLNPLLGGAYTAPRLIRLGWGEGLDEVGRWLNTQPDSQADQLGIRYKSSVFPFYEGSLASPVDADVDYVGFYVKQSQSGYPAPEILAYFSQQPLLHQVYLHGVDYAQVYAGPGMVLIEPNGNPLQPVAYRPSTIYAPIGQSFTIELLWPAGYLAQSGPNTANLRFGATDQAYSETVSAPIIETSPGVIVSQHAFTLPADLPRADYTLLLSDQPIGSLKARQITPPATIDPYEAVINHQLKLAGLRQQRQGEALVIDLAWQAWPQATNDYTVFIQLLNEAGERIAGVDVAPERGLTTLDRKEIMAARYTIPLPENLPPGAYQILVGMYYFAGDELINVGSVTLDQPFIME